MEGSNANRLLLSKELEEAVASVNRACGAAHSQFCDAVSTHLGRTYSGVGSWDQLLIPDSLLNGHLYNRAV